MQTASSPSSGLPAPQPALTSALSLALGFGLATVLFHLAANLWQHHLGWGYFRDEFYYVMCGRRLAWGYVDHGPLVAIQARLAEIVFGDSLAGLRLPAACAGAARVVLAGLLCRALGGGRPAQFLAMLGIALAPQYLAIDGFLSMNCAESLFWMSCLLVLLQMERSGERRLWIVFGLAGGVGLLNKPSMAFFLVALLAALLCTPQRRLLRTPWAAAGVALLLAIVAPYLHWQIAHQWPTWEFLHNGVVQHKNKTLAPPQFLLTQVLNLNPLSLFVWLPGLVYLLRRRPLRYLGLTYLLFLAGMMVLHAKDYYVVPIYPILFAAGGIAWTSRYRSAPRVRQARLVAFPVYTAVLVLTAIAILPMSTPLLTPAAWVAYARATHQFNSGSNSERAPSGLLPQFYADRFGWQEEVDSIARIFHALSPQEQRQAAILCSNYGEAGAIDFLGHGLPPAISGHNNYYLWGPRQASGAVVLAINGATLAEMQQVYDQVQIVGRLANPWSMPYEHRVLYLCRRRKTNLTQDWLELKHYD